MTDLLVALDVASIVGVAWGPLKAGIQPRTMIWTLPKKDPGDLVGARIATLENTLDEWFDSMEEAGHRVRWLVIAERFPSTNAAAAANSLGLDGIVRSECWRRDIDFRVQPEGTVRREVLGRGMGETKLMKALALQWCERQGISAADGNAADAAVLFHWTRAEMLRSRAA